MYDTSAGVRELFDGVGGKYTFKLASKAYTVMEQFGPSPALIQIYMKHILSTKKFLVRIHYDN